MNEREEWGILYNQCGNEALEKEGSVFDREEKSKLDVYTVYSYTRTYFKLDVSSTSYTRTYLIFGIQSKV